MGGHTSKSIPEAGGASCVKLQPMASNGINVCPSLATKSLFPLFSGNSWHWWHGLSPTGKVMMTTGTEPSSQQRHFPGTQATKQRQNLLLLVPRVKGACGIKGKLIGHGLEDETKPARALQPHWCLYLSGTDLGSAGPGAGTGATSTATSAPCHLCPQPPDAAEQVINSQTKAGV